MGNHNVVPVRNQKCSQALPDIEVEYFFDPGEKSWCGNIDDVDRAMSWKMSEEPVRGATHLFIRSLNLACIRVELSYPPVRKKQYLHCAEISNADTEYGGSSICAFPFESNRNDIVVALVMIRSED